MKRHFLYFLLIGAVLLAAAAVSCKPNKEIPKSTVTYPVSMTTVGRSHTSRTVRYEYDDAFRLIGKKTYTQDSLYTTETLSYDENGFQNGLKTETPVIGYTEEEAWQNDDAGRKQSGSKTVSQFGSSEVYTYSVTYDGQGRMLSYTETDSDGAVTDRKTWVYTDENGSSVCTTLSTVVTEILNGSGARVRYEAATSDGRVYASEEYEYDEDGRILSMTEDGTVTTYTYTETEYGTAANIMQNGNPAGTVVSEYDGDGHLIHKVTKDAYENVTEEITVVYSYLPQEE